MQSPYLKINGPQDEWKRTNFYEIQKAFYEYEADWKATHPQPVNLRVDAQDFEDEENSVPGRLQFKRWEDFMLPRVYPSGDITLPLTTEDRFQEYISQRRNENNSE